ncbi:TetR family transcriptional regulator [Gordonia sp. (in: high G+C Gram-positive bacteria)]|uniref:TetR family transcriptional regulator n=1 Tax=Gordonia sp. (in: high G+C Gram-positive bacteria) TaxID=84139 RepID=UPI003F9CE464
MNGPAFYDELRAIRLERFLDAAVAIITEDGWDRLSMTRVAQRSRVPRQSLYKEVGTKSDLGEVVVSREVERFVARVREGIDAHPDSIDRGLRTAAHYALEYGQTNPVLAAVLRPGHDPKLLAMLTVRPEAVLTQASSAISAIVGDRVSEGTVDTMVRLILSHLLQPTVTIDEAADRVMRAVH